MEILEYLDHLTHEESADILTHGSIVFAQIKEIATWDVFQQQIM